MKNTTKYNYYSKTKVIKTSVTSNRKFYNANRQYSLEYVKLLQYHYLTSFQNSYAILPIGGWSATTLVPTNRLNTTIRYTMKNYDYHTRKSHITSTVCFTHLTNAVHFILIVTYKFKFVRIQTTTCDTMDQSTVHSNIQPSSVSYLVRRNRSWQTWRHVEFSLCNLSNDSISEYLWVQISYSKLSLSTPWCMEKWRNSSTPS
jgi:hypothetical protein